MMITMDANTLMAVKAVCDLAGFGMILLIFILACYFMSK